MLKINQKQATASITLKGVNEAKTSECTAFCPICNSDLYYHEKACFCKSKACSWSCEKCKNETIS